MEQIVVKSESFYWLDVIDPSLEEFEEIAKRHGIHHTSVLDCLNPEHLPKHEFYDDLHFFLLRCHDEAAPKEADTVRELTRKMSVFFNDSFLITVHRKDQPYFVNIKNKWQKAGIQDSSCTTKILFDILRGVLVTFDKPIDQSMREQELLEMAVFGAQGSQPFKIKEGYYLKRRAWVFKRMLRLSIDLLPKMGASSFVKDAGPEFQDLRELADSLYFYADELIENVNSLLNLHISLASQKTNEASRRTNEVMRILTIFSLFLLPLNVITGIYGMNFENMPELKSPLGYPMALLSMVGVTAAVYIWFKRRGWLK